MPIIGSIYGIINTGRDGSSTMKLITDSPFTFVHASVATLMYAAFVISAFMSASMLAWQSSSIRLQSCRLLGGSYAARRMFMARSRCGFSIKRKGTPPEKNARLSSLSTCFFSASEILSAQSVIFLCILMTSSLCEADLNAAEIDCSALVGSAEVDASDVDATALDAVDVSSGATDFPLSLDFWTVVDPHHPGRICKPLDAMIFLSNY